MSTTSRRQQRIEAALDCNLLNWIAERRSAGRGWRQIADEIQRITGIQITGETLRVWSAGRLVVVPVTTQPSAQRSA